MGAAIITIEDKGHGVHITANFDPELRGNVPESSAQNLAVHLFQIGQSRAEEGDQTRGPGAGGVEPATTNARQENV